MLRLVTLIALATAACGGDQSRMLATDDDNGDGAIPEDPTVGSGFGCATDDDCRPTAATCCECPTFAVTADDPIFTACESVNCPQDPTCPASAEAVCDNGTCALQCQPMACPATGDVGYVRDASGCLTCMVAAPFDGGCTADTDCVEVRADCCGCARGGSDTAVLAGDADGYDAMLGCSEDDACPPVDVCAEGAAPRCVQGACALLDGDLPANACGRADLPSCPAGQVCTVNLDDDATARGLGVCAPS